MLKNLLNFIFFQSAWFAFAIFGGREGLLSAVIWSAIIVFFLHGVISENRGRDFLLIGLFLIAGFFIESCMLHFQIYRSVAPVYIIFHWAPLWLVLMWGLFATLLPLSMRWLSKHYGLAALLGVLFGPLSYFGGERMQVICIDEPIKAIIVLALVWGVAMPVSVWVCDQLMRRMPSRATY
jgi:hypothetical protein